MPDLLLELFSEEIPARMQAPAAKDLERLIIGALSDRGLLFESVKSFAGPRRLTLAVGGLPRKQPDTSEERKGPRVGTPEKAIEGFLRSAGVTLDQCITQTNGKGEFYVAVVRRAGRRTEEVLAEILPGTIAKLPWPKSMRWTAAPVRWVRPLRGIICTFDGGIVPFVFAGVESGNATFGHRFLSQGSIAIRDFEDYENKLTAAHVLLDPAQRRETILHESRQKAFAIGAEFVDDESLLEELAGLVEWPVPLIGRIQEEFMALPAPILQTSMRVHQKFFALRDLATETLANRFVVIANLETEDGGREIVAGNERVLGARLSDAKFFWSQDCRKPLAARVPELQQVVFHAKAGTMLDRANRIQSLAALIATLLDFDAAKARRAGLLAKADLVTGTVGEFPELQGTIGQLLALRDGEDKAVANAIGEQYQPAGSNDHVPSEAVSIVVALADKIDSLVTLWRAGEKPSGSRDPFALRRAGLGILRIVLQNRLRLPLLVPLAAVVILHRSDDGNRSSEDLLRQARGEERTALSEILAFLADRLKFALRDEGVRHDLIDAVFALSGDDDFVRLVGRVKALEAVLGTPDGANLLIAYRRAANILRIEEKRDSRSYEGVTDADRLHLPEEKELFHAMTAAEKRISEELARERYAEAMNVVAGLREPVDRFFDRVTVNAPEIDIRKNRLLLLSGLRRVLHTVADFSKIEG
ncbi:MAG TPA: glycine--tRNA ligase subunit beta [Rhizomicrobium sp.]|jgi:glycyl-tRNA synthetase beta chain|nr:glycine--tRNA ligase subunit beta [Rhizomicrobium sp.]